MQNTCTVDYNENKTTKAFTFIDEVIIKLIYLNP